MSQGRVSFRKRNLTSAIVLTGVLAGATAMMTTAASARVHHHRRLHHAASGTSSYGPPYSAMVVDANTGRTLYARNENELRHPASITKVMTLFLLFEDLEKGRLRLDSEIPVSAHAASMAPSKLGLHPGSTIAVEDAIKSIVTKSANDIAVAVAEAVGGSEDRFAELMTAKAHALGMAHTHYANASGLPDPEQLTTARDLTILGRAIQERFPRYYGYFSTHVFNYRGASMVNHNHLLGRVEGMDGIKTGYTRASGFNLLTSVRRGNKRIVSVVLGGPSVGVRDRIMANLIEDNLDGASTIRVAAAITDSTTAAEPARPVVPVERPAPMAFNDPQTDRLAPPVPLATPPERPRPAVIASATRPTTDDRTASIPEHRLVTLDGSTRAVTASSATPAVLPPMRWLSGPAAAEPKAAPPHARAPEPKVARLDPPRDIAQKPEPAHPAIARNAVLIQIGATDEVAKAQELLSRARAKSPGLGVATGYTEKVQKGGDTLWRARFAMVSEDQAQAACKSLKRSGFACFTTRN